MATPLLKTKLYTPPVPPKLVSRLHLIERLNEGIHSGCRLILVSAPAGFGKTTLLSEWTASTDRPVAWVSLDKSDNDPTRFWAYLVVALQTIEADIGQAALAMLRSPQPPVIEPMLIHLINEIAALPERFVLILDDYHVIQAQAIHEALTFLLDHPPLQMHLVIASRADPPLPVALFRGRGQVIELRQADLRFTINEASAFLNQVTGLNLGVDDIAALTARTEGWIAGLQMAALAMQSPVSMQGRDAERIRGFVAAFAGGHEYVADYLSDQVLSQQGETMRAFLLQTSILERMSGPLCDAVTGQDNGRQRLEKLQKANLFVVPLDDERHWYRYHHLFASLLWQRLQQTQSDDVPELHRRASIWYEDGGFVAEAVKHALLAGDFGRVEQLISHKALTMIYHGELATLAGWLESLPYNIICSRPWLCVAYAWILTFTNQLDHVEPLLREAEKALQGFDESVSKRHISGHIATIRAYRLGLKRETARAIALTREALEQLPEEDLMMRSSTMGMAGAWLRLSGDLVASDRTLSKAIALAQAADAHYLGLDFCREHAGLHMLRGQLHKAAATCREALRCAGDPTGWGGGSLPITGYVAAQLSLVLREWNDLEAAFRYASKGLAICQRWGQTNYSGFAYYAMARILIAMGDRDGALDAVQQLKQITRDLPPSIIALITAWDIQIRLAQGDTVATRHWIQASGLHIDDELVFHRYREYCTLAQALIALGQPSDALPLLARLLEITESRGATICAIEVLVTQAIALQATSQVDLAVTALCRALVLAAPEGFVRTFIDEGAPMVELLKQAIAQGIATDYAHTLLTALEDEMSGKEPILSLSEELIEPLSEREMEVLRLLSTDLSRKEIADQLCVSPNTVRFHEILSNVVDRRILSVFVGSTP